MSRTFCIVAGETSGDILGGLLVSAIKQHHPEYRFIGVGGHRMQEAGVEILMDAQQLAVMGLFEVLSKFNLLRHSMKTLVKQLKETPPNLLILIDYPGFNLRLAAKAKALGITVMYYVSPQIWAWHYSRIQKIKRCVDHMAVLFPFEEKLYQKEGVPVTFVGHPVVEAIKPTLTREQSVERFHLDPTKPVIGLLPGSRPHEIKRLLPILLTAASHIKAKQPNTQFVLIQAAHLPDNLFASYDLRDITQIRDNTHNAIQICESVIATSGTVTLEVALLGVPMVVIYQVNALTAFIGRRIRSIRQMEKGERSFALCNIVAEERLMPELLQRALTPEAISRIILDWLLHPEKTHRLRQKLTHLGTQLQGANAADRAARVAVQMANL